LLGIGADRLWLFPLVQALVSGLLGLITSFGLFFLASIAAEWMFDSGLAESGGLVKLGAGQIALICIVVLGFVAFTAFFAARAASKVDPADVLREGTT